MPTKSSTIDGRKTTQPRRTAPRKTAAKKTAPAKPVKKSSVVSKADLEKRLEQLQREIIDTVEEYTDDGTLCDSERRNIEERFSGLGVNFPVKTDSVELSYHLSIRCKEMPYSSDGYSREIDANKGNLIQNAIEEAILKVPLPDDCYIQSIDLNDYDFDHR